MSRHPWLSSEPTVSSALAQCVALWRAALQRPWLTWFLALGITAAVGLGVAFGRRSYAPSFVLRVVEAQHRSANVPPLKRQLAEYVRQAVFTSQPLLELMHRYGLYPSLLRKNERAALDSFREDISIDVYQNYFVEDRAPGGAPRSARLTVSYRSKDPAQALAVTRALGALIVSREQATRRDQALVAAQRADQARDILVSAYQRRSADVVAKQSELLQRPTPDTRLQVELVGLLGSLGSLEHQVDAAERRASTLEVGATLERQGMGLSFQVVDDGSLPGLAARVRAALLASAATFFFGLPLVALGVGAFAVKRGPDDE
jgi:hypothetical protein